jgi:putative peptidoglycan lipid II flippase
MLPQGMFSVAVVTVLFPTLSRFAAVGNLPSFRTTLDSGLRQIAFLLLPAAAVSAVLAQPIVRLLYERGAFTPDNTVVVAQCLAAFSLGLMFNGWMLLLSRGFYSLQRNWVPTTIALGTVGLNAVLDAFLYRVGVWGIPLATSLVNIVGVALLLVAMRRRPGLAGVRGVVASVLRILVASAVAAGLAYGVWWVLDDVLGRDLWAQIVSLGVGLTAGAGVYLAAAKLLGVRELEALRALRRD